MDGKGFEVWKGECGAGVENDYLLPHSRGKVGMGGIDLVVTPHLSPPPLVGEERED